MKPVIGVPLRYTRTNDERPILYIGCLLYTSQMIIGRVFDIDDILLNLLGGILGFACYYGLSKIGEKLPSVLKSCLLYTSFNQFLFDSDDKVLEEVLYSISYSVFDNYDV